MPEYFVSILNWPVEAESLKDAARTAYISLKKDPTGFHLTVTDEEGSLCHIVDGYNPFGFKERGEFDTYDFEETPEDD